MNQNPQLLVNGLPLLNPYVGIGVYARRLVQGLLRHKPSLSFSILLPENAKDIRKEFDSNILDLVAGRTIKKEIISNIYWSHRIAKRAIERYPDAIFHSPGPFFSCYHPQKTIITVHDSIAHYFPRYLGKFFIRRWLASLSETYARRSSLILTVSEYSARDISNLLQIPREKIEVIYNWIDNRYFQIDRVREAFRVREKLKLPELFWLYIGGYDYRKNVEFLLRAYAAARQTCSLPPLVLAGDVPRDLSKPYCDVWGALKETSLGADQILLPGRISHEDMPGLYAASALLLYPSLYEGFGLPPAEAMAVGTPVLVSDGTSLPEVVRRPECRFDPVQMDDLVEKMKKAAADPTQFQCPFPEEFTENTAIDRYLEVVRRLSPK
jgi:glycosyltransferase involved in cell wall biosynthesis